MSNNQAMVVSPVESKQASLKKLLEQSTPALSAVLPKHVTASRLIKVALSATARKPDLLKCTAQSLIKAVFQGAELGLEAGGLLGDGYIVPMGNEAQFIIGYRGMVKLARQSGNIKNIETRVVRANDEFDIEFGLEPKLKHKPFIGGDPGDMVFVYAIATFREGEKQVEVMSKSDVEKIRKRSKASGSGPWVTDYEEMAKKTVLRRLCKMLPLSPELAKAVANDGLAEAGERVATEIDSALQPQDPQLPQQSRADALKNHLQTQDAEFEPTQDYDHETGEIAQ